MASSPKIHMFKKSAIEAGTPEDYYLNPSDNLWKIASMWSVDENEDVLALSINMVLIGDRVFIMAKENIVNIEVDVENKEKAVGFDHEDGMKNFSIEMNPKFLKYEFNSDPSPYSVSADHGGTAKFLITKLKSKKESSAGRISDQEISIYRVLPRPEGTAKLFMNKLELKKESSAVRISDLD